MRPMGVERRVAHGALALIVLLGAVLGMSAAPAGACACGAMADPRDERSDATITEETAMLSLEDGTETIVLSLLLDAQRTGAALIMPTPSAPTVTEGDGSTLRELAVATEPREERELDWWGEGWRGDGTGGAPGSTEEATPPGTVDVLSQERVGAFDVAVLDGSAEGVTAWLDENGFVLADSVLALLPAYAEEGWIFTAVRYTADVDLSADIAPLRFDFASEELVYPMRLSQAATQTQRVHLFVLGDEPMMRTDGSDEAQSVSRPWIAMPETVDWTWSDDTLRELAADRYVTEFVISGQPETFTADFAFGPDPEDPWVVPRKTVRVPVEIAGIPAGRVLVVLGAAIAVLALYGAAVTVLAVTGRTRRR